MVNFYKRLFKKRTRVEGAGSGGSPIPSYLMPPDGAFSKLGYQLYEALDLICEGPILGLTDQNGKVLYGGCAELFRPGPDSEGYDHCEPEIPSPPPPRFVPVGGAATWTHTVSSQAYVRNPDLSYTPTCVAELESILSIRTIDPATRSIEFTRINNDPACEASGSIVWIISSNSNGVPNLMPVTLGDRGETTVIEGAIGSGRYYVIAYGININGFVDSEPQKILGRFDITANGEIEIEI